MTVSATSYREARHNAPGFNYPLSGVFGVRHRDRNFDLQVSSRVMETFFEFREVVSRYQPVMLARRLEQTLCLGIDSSLLLLFSCQHVNREQ